MSEIEKPIESKDYTRMTGEVYDLIYSKKDYETEADKISDIITQRCESGGKDLLEAACGTGTYMELLIDRFNVEGFDLSSQQVEGAKTKLPGVKIEVADMTEFDMGKQYDAVICLFSSIGYVQTPEKLDMAIGAFGRHIKPGGVLIVEPWLPKEVFKPGHVSIDTNQNDSMAVSRIGITSVEGNISVLSMHHMVGTAEGVEHFVEEHKLGLFSDQDFTNAYKKAGLDIEKDPKGLTGNRGLYIGNKPL